MNSLLKSATKNLVYLLLSRLNLFQVGHKVITKNTLSILTYHAIINSKLLVDDWCFLDTSSFYKQIAYLKSHFKIVSLSNAIDLLKNDELNVPTAVVTFDDGFQNNYDTAFPILCDEEVPATIFLSTKFVDTDDTIWFCRLNDALGKTGSKLLEWNGEVFNISGPEQKAVASARIQTMLKEIPHPQLLNETQNIIRQLGDDPDRPIPYNSPYRMLSSKAILEMAKSGLIEFGAHTHNHAILNNLSLIDKKNEITNSIKFVEQKTMNLCKYFAYPNGREEDFDNESMTIIKSCGIDAAVTMIMGPNDSATSLMQLRRYGIGRSINISEFQALIHNFIWYFKKIRKIPNFILRH